MKFTLIGTAAAPGIPVYGSNSPACDLARKDPSQRRQKTSAMLECDNGKRILFDANADDFLTRFPRGSFEAIYLTHFHMDHVGALFDMRWGAGEKIPVYHPDDSKGADDLFKHPGILDFKTIQPFIPIDWQGATITPVPLTHSRPTLGYVIDVADTRLAYLTDSAWMPEETLAFLQARPIAQLFLDTSHPPQPESPRNHHDVYQAKRVFELLKPKKMGLIHITRDVLNWSLAHPEFFDGDFYLARDGDKFVLAH